jgi:hypothetical protein
MDRTWAQESSEIAKQAQNPIANLISLPLESDFLPQTGINRQDSYVLQIKPFVPFPLSSEWNLITRTIIPIIQEPEPVLGVSGASGLGDVQESLFFSPAKAGALIWGVGPVISVPTATQGILGTRKVSIGPTVVVLRSRGHWLFGSLVQNLFSVAGTSGRSDVNQMLIQPFANYNLRHGWYFTSSPVVTANWKASSAQTWTVPVGGGVGRIVRFGKQPVTNEVTHWSARLQVQFLFPEGKREH